MLIIQSVPQFMPHLDQARLEQLTTTVLAGEGITEDAELSLVVTDDEGIRTLNRQYRGLDAATDVLSFPLLAGHDDPFIQPPDGIVRLGDVVISCERALVQAQELAHPVRQEIEELFVHGLLHILGYDHESDADAPIMAAKAEHYLG